MKSVALATLIVVACTLAMPAQAQAQDVDPAQVLSRVCVSYANRSASFEKAIRNATDLRFRRPLNSVPLEDYASEVDMISHDGVWRLRLEEGTVTRDDRDLYVVNCSLSSTRASISRLAATIDRVLGRDPVWAKEGQSDWERPHSDGSSLTITVNEPEDQRPTLTVMGLYP